jgi:tetratricopeptide (TPR) repeat protein
MFRKVTELTPDNARAYANLGAAYLAQGSFDRAVAEFQKSVALAPNDLAWSNLGTAQYYLGRYADAAAAYEKAIGLLPDHYENWGNLGDAYRQLPGRESKAAGACEKSVALARMELGTNPRDATARSYLALCLAKTGKTEEAEAEAHRSLEAAPTGPEILYNAAIVSNRAGKTSEALDLLRKALQAGYTAEIARREPELANLRGVPAFQEIVQSERRRGS